MLNIIHDGLVMGSILALVACSFNVIHRPTNILNFAQGDFVMVGAMLAAVAMTILGLPWIVGLLVVLAGSAALGLAEERIAAGPVLRRSATSMAWVITTLAFSIIIQNIVSEFWGANPRSVDVPPGFSLDTVQIGGTPVSSYDAFVVVVAIAIILGLEWMNRRPIGIALAAVATDRESAQLRGIDPKRLTRWSFAVGGAVAGVAGLLAGPILLASPDLSAQFLLTGFAAAAIGTIGSNRGALVGGYVIGFAQAVASSELTPGYQSLATFVVLLAILLVRPQGLFGTKEARSV